MITNPNTQTDLLLEVRDLKTYFRTMDGVVRAVDGVNMAIKPGKTLGVVGESGSGKSVTAFTCMRLLSSNGFVQDGEVYFQGTNLLDISEEEMRRIRGNKISMIFQEPMTSLNPVYTIGDQVSEVLKVHKGLRGRAVRDRTIEMLRRVGIPGAERRLTDYPHNLSGGMRQRVMIAMALATDPALLIADEPTTALDVTIQAQILDLMRGLTREFNTSIMLITHDLGVVAEMADDVAVMYTGQIVERGSVYQVLKEPKHPYTLGLLNSIPSETSKGQKLNVIRGTVPNPLELPQGCTFAPRCPYVMDICRKQEPKMVQIAPGHTAHCWLYQSQGGIPHQPQNLPSWNAASEDYAQREAAARASVTTEATNLTPTADGR